MGGSEHVVDYLYDCLRNLPPSGDSGVEGLVRRLLESWTGARFYLARSGTQSGRDASTGGEGSVGIAVEVKRYKAGTALVTRDLTGALAEAIVDSHLDLWILAATTEVSDQQATLLKQIALSHGVDVLIIDTRGGPALSRLGVLAARESEIVLEHIIDNAERPVDRQQLDTALNLIRTHPRFGEEVASLEKLLKVETSSLDTIRESSHAWLRKALSNESEAEAAFGQHLAIRGDGRLIQRTAIHSSLTRWWNQGRPSVPLHFVHGEEGMGKTWAIADWILSRIEQNEPLPAVLFASSSFVETGDAETPEALVARLLHRVRGGAAHSLESSTRRIERMLAADDRTDLDMLVVIDGLNERPEMNWRKLFAAVSTDRWRRNVAVLASGRTQYLRRTLPLFETAPKTEAGPYRDEELTAALRGSGIDPGSLPSELRALLARPRYCDLAIRHRARLESANDVSVARLYFEDTKDRWRRKSDYPMTDEDLASLVQELARKYENQAKKTYRASEIRSLTADSLHAPRAAEEVLSGGLFVAEPAASGVYRINPDRLSYGLGLVLWDDFVEQVGRSRSDDEMIEWITARLEPHRDADFKVRVLGYAAFCASMYIESASEHAQAMFSAWIDSRNLSDDAEASLASYFREAPDRFLAILPRFWRSSVDNTAARNRLVQAIAANRNLSGVEDALAAAILSWMGMVHRDGHEFARELNSRHPDHRTQVPADWLGYSPEIGPLELQGLKFTIVDDDGLTRLPKLALSIISEGDRRPHLEAFVTRAAATVLMGDPLGNHAEEWTLRLATEDLRPLLQERLEQLRAKGVPLLTKAMDRLTRWSGNTAPTRLRSNESCSSPSEDETDERLAHRLSNSAIDPHAVVSTLERERIEKWAVTTFAPDVLSPGASTVRDYAFTRAEPTLARWAPAVLIEISRSVIRSLPQRELEEQHSLLFYFSNYLLILGPEEIAALEQTRRQLGSLADELEKEKKRGTIGTRTSVEMNCFLGELWHYLGMQQLAKLLSRPDAAFEAKRFEQLFKPLSSDELDAVCKTLSCEQDATRLRRTLWFLRTQDKGVSPDQSELLLRLASHPDENVRINALRLILYRRDRLATH